ncbi:hypothetical protein YC2023_091541 [Brassica napus]
MGFTNQSKKLSRRAFFRSKKQENPSPSCMHIFIKNKQLFPLTEAESFLHRYARKKEIHRLRSKANQVSFALNISSFANRVGLLGPETEPDDAVNILTTKALLDFKDKL